jgi:hypothetical protein
MDLPETLALPRAKQESQYLQRERVNLVQRRRLKGVHENDHTKAEAAAWPRLTPRDETSRTFLKGAATCSLPTSTWCTWRSGRVAPAR